MREVLFNVRGVPVAKGSKNAFYNKRIGRAMMVETNAAKQKPWVSAIACAAAEAMQRNPPSRGMVMVKRMTFTFPRPKSHYGTGKNSNVLKPGAPIYHLSKPDADKLQRCVFDAIKGIVYEDDCQVCHLDGVSKVYANASGHAGLEMELSIE